MFRTLGGVKATQRTGQSLRPYHWSENTNHIRNRSGIVFSDEYHLDSDKDPAYYLARIVESAKKVGLDFTAERAY